MRRKRKDKSQLALEAVRDIAMRKAYLPKQIAKYIFEENGRLTIKVKKR